MPTPPLSQSKESLLACDEHYATVVIDGRGSLANEDSYRGSEIHHVMSQYVNHCSSNGIEADWRKFDELAEAVGPDAGDILDGMRDNYKCDHEHVYATELYLTLNDDLTSLACMKGSPAAESAGYEGTLDVLLLFGNEDSEDAFASAKIEDYKSHWRPFEADTFQSLLHPFLVFQHFATVNEVTFELIFVRFKNARRSVTYSRADMPKMAVEIERARKRQLAVHAKVEYKRIETGNFSGKMPSGGNFVTGVGIAPRKPMDAMYNKSCTWCPRMKDLSCPLGKQNPYDSGMTIEQRLVQICWLTDARAHQMSIVKDFIDKSDRTVEFADGNGQRYEARYKPTESGYFPLVETVEALIDWKNAGDDLTLFNGLRVGSSQLKAKLKTKKRATLDQHLRDTVMVRETKTQFGIRKPDGTVDDGRPPEVGEEW